MTDWILPFLCGLGASVISAWGVGGGTLLDMSDVVVPDGTLASALSSPVTSDLKALRLKGLYRNYVPLL